MGVPDPISSFYSRARTYRRFNLQFSVCLNFQSEGLVRRLEGVSENVSLGGLLLNTGAEIPLHTKVSLTIDLASPLAAEPLRLIAQGKVVRVEPLVQAHGFAIAVERNHPISTVKKHLVASGSAHASFAVK